jgi:hypothetical protein
MQEGNLHSPRSCATAFPCVVKQGLLFVKPQPLPKRPAAATVTTIVTSGSSSSSSSSSSALGAASSGNSSSHSGGVTAAVDPYADVPTVQELDQEGWVSQVGGLLGGCWCLLQCQGWLQLAPLK